MEGLSKKEKELTDTDNSVVMGEGGEWVEVEKGVRGINGNVNTIKNKLLKKRISTVFHSSFVGC